MPRNKRRLFSVYIPEWIVRRKPITPYNPAKEPVRAKTSVEPVYSVFDYNPDYLQEFKYLDVTKSEKFIGNGHMTWINIDGLKKEEVEQLCDDFNVHRLLAEDILSTGQRAKLDEVEGVILCLLPMLYFNDETDEVESEQVSMVLGKDFLLSFQEDPERDVFNPVRGWLRAGNARLRERNSDYLCYSLLDVIVDSYFSIIEKLNEQIEELEDDLISRKEEGALARIVTIRREVMIMKRAIMPVRELVSSFMRTSNPLVDERNVKYFKDVSDHIIQANDYSENQRDMLMNLQDLYMNQINLRMNEVMKIFTMVALLLAPATVIGGIFGMNFEAIPGIHNQRGFYISVTAMLVIPILMLIYFKRKKWF
jgi:magnesium transporter